MRQCPIAQEGATPDGGLTALPGPDDRRRQPSHRPTRPIHESGQSSKLGSTSHHPQKIPGIARRLRGADDDHVALEVEGIPNGFRKAVGSLASVELGLDDDVPTHHLYPPRETQHRGDLSAPAACLHRLDTSQFHLDVRGESHDGAFP